MPVAEDLTMAWVHRRPRRLVLGLALAGAAGLAWPPRAAAQRYPSRPVRLVVPFAPGAGLDDLSRLLAAHLSQQLGQPVVVESRPGANTGLAAGLVAHAPPDGHTLLFTPASTLLVNPLVDTRIGYRGADDFVPVARVMSVVQVLLVRADGPYASLEALRGAARGTRPLDIAFFTHVQRALHTQLASALGLRVVHVPYRTFPAAMPDLVAGRIDAAAIDAGTALTAVQGGRLRALLVLGPQRTPVLPDVPTTAEAGLPVPPLTSWLAIYAPAGTPAEVVEPLSRAVLDFVRSPAATRYFAQRGNLAWPGGREEVARQLRQEQRDWQRLVEEAGIRPE